MAKAVKCPVCTGAGQILQYPPEGSTIASPWPVTCHGCGGSGWVLVSE